MSDNRDDVIAGLRGQVASMSTIMEAFPEKHMRFGYIRDDGTFEAPTKCADWCYACQLARRHTDIAYRIRAELVCCDLYDRINVRKELTLAEAMESKDWHDLCYWAEASARIAEGQCPGYETEPNICQCGCEGCKVSCNAHTKTTGAR